ncbi:hypothetical protein [Actinoplanes sp. GCM10030250]|uniref:hypothetical protein n=1 Tax=Actinoplanes sp. GCM10030250 TaxID=3273376 RepID=UPI0036199885
MTDRLDQLVEAATPLLARVDTVLSTAGAPEGHPVWPELRRVRLLPGDAVRAVCDLRPEAISAAVPHLRTEARTYAALADALPLTAAWSGEAADAYEQARRRTAQHLNGGPDSLSRRMEATADYADALTAWMTRARTDLALALTEALTSAEALTLTAGNSHPPGTHSPAAYPPDAHSPDAHSSGTHSPDQQARAAADVSALLLRTIADAYDQGEALLDDSAPLQNPLLV